MTEKSISYSLGQAEFVEALKVVIASTVSRDRWRGWPAAVFNGAILLQVIILLLVAYSFREGASLAFYVGFLIIVIQLISYAVVNRLTGWRMGTTYDRRRHENVTATLVCEGIRHVGPEHRQFWSWSLLRHLHVQRDVLTLEFVGSDMLALPRNAFPTESELNEWVEAIREKLPGNALRTLGAGTSR